MHISRKIPLKLRSIENAFRLELVSINRRINFGDNVTEDQIKDFFGQTQDEAIIQILETGKYGVAEEDVFHESIDYFRNEYEELYEIICDLRCDYEDEAIVLIEKY